MRLWLHPHHTPSRRPWFLDESCTRHSLDLHPWDSHDNPRMYTSPIVLPLTLPWHTDESPVRRPSYDTLLEHWWRPQRTLMGLPLHSRETSVNSRENFTMKLSHETSNKRSRAPQQDLHANSMKNLATTPWKGHFGSAGSSSVHNAVAYVRGLPKNRAT